MTGAASLRAWVAFTVNRDWRVGAIVLAPVIFLCLIRTILWLVS